MAGWQDWSDSLISHLYMLAPHKSSADHQQKCLFQLEMVIECRSPLLWTNKICYCLQHIRLY